MTEPILEIKNLTVQYDNNYVVLDNLNLSVEAGEFISIVGKSGSGKTSLLNAIAGFIKFNGLIKGEKNFSYIFQDKSLFPWMTVKNNILFGFDDKSSHEKKDLLKIILNKVNLAGFENRYPHQLSGGQAQRVVIARSMALSNRLILCDEPFSALDYITKENIIDWFLSNIDEKKTFLFVTHNIEDAILLSDRVIIIKEKKCLPPVIINVPRNERIGLRNSEKIIPYKQQIDLLIQS